MEVCTSVSFKTMESKSFMIIKDGESKFYITGENEVKKLIIEGNNNIFIVDADVDELIISGNNNTVYLKSVFAIDIKDCSNNIYVVWDHINKIKEYYELNRLDEIENLLNDLKNKIEDNKTNLKDLLYIFGINIDGSNNTILSVIPYIFLNYDPENNNVYCRGILKKCIAYIFAYIMLFFLLFLISCYMYNLHPISNSIPFGYKIISSNHLYP